jgi:hypothetical protein
MGSTQIVEITVLSKIYEPKREKIAVSWRNFHNKELHNLCCSPDSIKAMKSRMMRYAQHVTCM